MSFALAHKDHPSAFSLARCSLATTQFKRGKLGLRAREPPPSASRESTVRSKLLVLSVIAVLALASPVECAQSAPNVRYYVDGKRIPTPAQLPPVYPAKELKRRITGTTVVAFSYDSDGKVTAATVKTSSGNKNLDNAAVAAVRQWTVVPQLKDGMPSAGESETPVTFSL